MGVQSFYNGQMAGEGYGGFGGGTTDEGRKILDNGELNLGGQKDVNPVAGLTDQRPGIGPEVRLVELRGDSKLATWVTVSFNLLPVSPATPLSNPQVGPLVGIVEFGNGSAINRVEVDIQQGNWISSILPGGASPLGNAFPLPPGGTMISVPTGALRAFARNDGGYQPLGDGNAIGNVTNIAKVMAHAAYGQKPASEANTRTIWLTSRAAQAAGFVNACGIPPFARSFRVYRTTLNNVALSINIEDSFGVTINGPIVVPAGTDCPNIILGGLARSVRVTSAGPASTIMSAVFNIQL